ncbi:MAG: AraC family transcriptional regulator [Oscillospiraceae bacterium]|nr:AraC family transcriptional regulator [Oscillospiraceae bacterium]
MEWIESITKAIRYIENNLTNDISIEDVANHVFMSEANFQRIFHLVTDITIGDYIRNRRLSLSGRDLFLTDSKVIDIAMRYQYDTSESFSKAFARFHGIPPSVVKKHGDKLKCFSPLTINIFIRGGFNMSRIVMENDSGAKIICENFEYLTLGKLQFIGIDAWPNEGWDELWARRGEFMPALDALMSEYGTDITDDCAFLHHNGHGVDTENHYLAGRFFKAGTPVPEGYDYYDVPTERAAYAVYTTNKYDGDIGLAYYFTRDQILSEGVTIPYPLSYWHAAVYTDGRPKYWHTARSTEENHRFGYMFSVGE